MTPEQNRRAAFASVIRELKEWDGLAGSLYWLSFVNREKPSGEQFLGACIVRAPSLRAAMPVSHILKCNPGGSVVTADLSRIADRIDKKWLSRLLNREEIAQFEAEVYGASLESFRT